ncbi:hypothetical protein EWM64_g2571 [Hericium alpestre]|uniref:Non-haem dioxygenase N-terminal domain-containing protein n=1 Tax=Hericium alpestre TaxID=135208 RepID=A0A4Z0A4Q6_9AGAM|nr:hypothetical protein EWM64_g2571 [Hericium alpestre]
MPGIVDPPFPDDVPTVPLVVIDYALLCVGDSQEVDRLWNAATELGFWYLNNHGADELADAMFEMGEATMALPLEEKMQFKPDDAGASFGYKHAGANAVDANGTPDVTEFLNISKDDALAYPAEAHRTYPNTVATRMDAVVRPFVLKSLEVNETILGILNNRLGLPEGALASRHRRELHSCCEARTIRAAPVAAWREEKAMLGAHTDFGSLSFLQNRLGGLQVLPPGADGWKYVKASNTHVRRASSAYAQ